MTPEKPGLLPLAAAPSNETQIECLRGDKLEAAVETHADCPVFVIDDMRWPEFMAALDRPPAENRALKALLARRPAWES